MNIIAINSVVYKLPLVVYHARQTGRHVSMWHVINVSVRKKRKQTFTNIPARKVGFGHVHLQLVCNPRLYMYSTLLGFSTMFSACGILEASCYRVRRESFNSLCGYWKKKVRELRRYEERGCDRAGTLTDEGGEMGKPEVTDEGGKRGKPGGCTVLDSSFCSSRGVGPRTSNRRGLDSGNCVSADIHPVQAVNLVVAEENKICLPLCIMTKQGER